MSNVCRRWLGWPVLGIVLLLAVGQVRAEESGSADSVHVGGAVTKPADWTAAKLKDAFAGQLKQVEYTVKGQKHVSTCVPLLAVVQAAQPVTDPKHKSSVMRLAVVVRAADRYAATFALGELLPDVGNHPAWIAIDMDGQPLTGREAPVKVIVPDEAKPARSVWGVTRIDVVDPVPAGETNSK